MLPRFLTRLATIGRERGVRAVWFVVIAELGYRRMLVREVALDSPIPDITPSLPVTFDQLRPDQIEEYKALRKGEKPHLAETRLADGHRCFVARHADAIVCVCWAATGRAWSEYLSAPIPLAPGEAYLYDMFTRVDVRGKGVAEALRAEMCRWYRDRGFRRVLSYMVPENPRAMARRVEFRNIGRIGRIRVAGFRYDFIRMAPGKLAPGEAPRDVES
jgi:GNAT superfamily N-acetyltransferase